MDLCVPVFHLPFAVYHKLVISTYFFFPQRMCSCFLPCNVPFLIFPLPSLSQIFTFNLSTNSTGLKTGSYPIENIADNQSWMWLSSWRCWRQICGTVAVFTFCPVFFVSAGLPIPFYFPPPCSVAHGPFFCRSCPLSLSQTLASCSSSSCILM